MLNATVLPLMHGSTSPLTNDCPACSQGQLSLNSATARRTSEGFQVFDEVALFIGAEAGPVVVADIAIARDACIETE